MTKTPAFMIRANRDGRAFAAVIVRKGDRTGRNGCLIHEDERPVVRFFDLTYPHELISQDLSSDVHVSGQFVSSYFLETLLGRDEFNSGGVFGALNLQGGVPEWYIDAPTMNEFMRFMTAEADRT